MFQLQSVKTEFEIRGFNSIYYFEFGKNFSHPPEKHDFWEMVYVDKGSIIAVTDGTRTTLEQGQAIFHEPMETHAHISDRQAPNNMLIISFTSESPAMSFFKKKIFTLGAKSKKLLSLFLGETKNALRKLPGDYNNKNDLDFSGALFGSSQLLQCYFTEFLICLYRSGNKFSAKSVSVPETHEIPAGSITAQIISYMKENIFGKITLSDICGHFMLGRSRVEGIFKENTGKSMIKYYTGLKISEAKRLLRDDTRSVGEISNQLGYSSIYSFSRTFKNETGFSPTAYKKSIL